MTRWKLTIEYDGRPYFGWQRQAHGLSIQQEIEQAIAKFSGETVRLHTAGRTDAGVHALAQVAHFDLERPSDGKVVREALNAYLRPQPISILAAEAVGPHFHARMSARRRRYRDVVLNRQAFIGYRPSLARALSAGYRGNGRRRVPPDRPPRFFQLPRQRMPGQIAYQDARPVGHRDGRRQPDL